MSIYQKNTQRLIMTTVNLYLIVLEKEINFAKFDKYIKKRMKEEIDVISGSRIVFLRE
jgi:hypothetical protein